MDSSKVRLDVLVSSARSNLTRSQSAKLIKLGNVKVNGETVKKPSSVVSYDSSLRVSLPRPASPKDLVVPIIFENKDVVVIDKPTGVLCHSKGGLNTEATLADWLALKLKHKPSTNREGIVHRLDRATSGVMILAKNKEAEGFLMKQFSSRKVDKRYKAVVSGHLNIPSAIIDMPIIRNPKNPKTFKADSVGKAATTKYVVKKESAKLSLLELRPKTGRTHQLRVHLSSISHPIVGDSIYGGKPADRLFLHATELSLTLPGESTKRSFKAKLPTEFNEIMK